MEAVALPLLGGQRPEQGQIGLVPDQDFVIPESPSFVLNKFQQRCTVVLDHLPVTPIAVKFVLGHGAQEDWVQRKIARSDHLPAASRRFRRVLGAPSINSASKSGAVRNVSHKPEPDA